MLIRSSSLLLATLPAVAAAGCLVAADVVPAARTVAPEAGLTVTVYRLAPSSDIRRDGFSSASTVDVELGLRNESGGRRTVLLAQGRLLLHSEGARGDFAGEAVAVEQLAPPCERCRFEQQVDRPTIPPLIAEPGGEVRVRLTFGAFPERSESHPLRATLQLPIENGPVVRALVVDPITPGGPRLRRDEPIHAAAVGLGARARWLGGPWGGPATDPVVATLWLPHQRLVFGPGVSLGMIAPDATRATGPSLSGSVAMNAAWLPDRMPVGVLLSAELLVARLQPPALYQDAGTRWLKLPSLTAGLLWTFGGAQRVEGPLPVEHRRMPLQRFGVVAGYTHVFNTGESWGSSALTVGFVVVP